MEAGSFGLIIEEQHVQLLMHRGQYGIIRNSHLDRRQKIDYVVTRDRNGQLLRHPFENQITTRDLSLAKFEKYCASRQKQRCAASLYTVIPAAEFVETSVDGVEFLIHELDQYDWPAMCVHVLEIDRAGGVHVWRADEFHAILLARRAEAVTQVATVCGIQERSIIVRVRGIRRNIHISTDEITGRSLRIAYNNHLRGLSTLVGVQLLVGVHPTSHHGINAKLRPSGPRVSKVT